MKFEKIMVLLWNSKTFGFNSFIPGSTSNTTKLLSCKLLRVVVIKTDNLNNNKVKLFVENIIKSSGLFKNSSIDVVFNSEKEKVLSRLLSNSICSALFLKLKESYLKPSFSIGTIISVASSFDFEENFSKSTASFIEEYFTIFKPFSSGLWCSIALVLLCTSAIYLFLESILLKKQKKNFRDLEKKTESKNLNILEASHYQKGYFPGFTHLLVMKVIKVIQKGFVLFVSATYIASLSYQLTKSELSKSTVILTKKSEDYGFVINSNLQNVDLFKAKLLQMKWKGKIDSLIRELSVINKQFTEKFVFDLKSFTGIYMILAAVLMIATFLVCFFKMLPFQKKQQSLIKVKNKLKINLETGNNKEKLTEKIFEQKGCSSLNLNENTKVENKCLLDVRKQQLQCLIPKNNKNKSTVPKIDSRFIKSSKKLENIVQIPTPNYTLPSRSTVITDNKINGYQVEDDSTILDSRRNLQPNRNHFHTIATSTFTDIEGFSKNNKPVTQYSAKIIQRGVIKRSCFSPTSEK